MLALQKALMARIYLKSLYNCHDNITNVGTLSPGIVVSKLSQK